MDVTRTLLNDYNEASRWDARSKTSGCFRILRQRVRRFLASLSGNNIISMLDDVLTHTEKQNLSLKYIQALRGLSTAVNNTQIVKQKKLHHFIRPLRLAGITMPEINELGFKCGKFLWRTCLNINERNLAGRPRISNDLIDEIKAHMESISNIAANRSVVLRTYSNRDTRVYYKKKTISKLHVSALYRQTSINAAFRAFKEQANGLNEQIRERRLKLPFSSFYKKIDNRFKKPFKQTDLCNYCQYGHILQKQIKLFMRDHQDYDQEFNTDKMITYLENNRNPADLIKIEKIQLYKSVEYHKRIAVRQRNSYNLMRLDPTALTGKIMIDFDYKAQILLGLGPRQLNSEFYEANKKKVFCLGFGIYHLNGGRINTLNIDVITDIETQDSGDVAAIFRYVMTLPFFIEVDQPNWVLYSDCGSNFRSAEFLYFCTNYLAQKGKCVSLNVLVEKHGECS